MMYARIDYLDNLRIIITTVVTLNTVKLTVVKNTVLEIFSFSVYREKGGYRQRRKKIFNKFSRSGNFSGLRRFVRFGFAEKIMKTIFLPEQEPLQTPENFFRSGSNSET